MAGVLSGRSSSVSSPTHPRGFATALPLLLPDAHIRNGLLTDDDVDHLAMGMSQSRALRPGRGIAGDTGSTVRRTGLLTKGTDFS